MANTFTRRPVTPDTLFEVASNSKVITAYIALQLVDQGTLSLDEPLSEPTYTDTGLDAETVYFYIVYLVDALRVPTATGPSKRWSIGATTARRPPWRSPLPSPTTRC